MSLQDLIDPPHHFLEVLDLFVVLLQLFLRPILSPLPTTDSSPAFPASFHPQFPLRRVPIPAVLSSRVLSQASTSDSAVTADPLCEFASNPESIARFTRLIGHEDVFPAVFDSNNRGVDFYFLPVYYTPQLCGFAPDSALKIAPNSVIADRYLILRELGQATFSITVECIDMRAAGNEHLCLKVGFAGRNESRSSKKGTIFSTNHSTKFAFCAI